MPQYLVYFFILSRSAGTVPENAGLFKSFSVNYGENGD